VEGVENRLRALSPQNDAQRLLQSRALQISGEVAQARWLAIEQAENTTQRDSWWCSCSGLPPCSPASALFAPRNAVALAVLFVGALSIAGSIFLIEELNDPLGEMMAISSAPMHKALTLLGQ
jgi:hypothetical protein